jgi:hypothetical protein
MAEWIKSRAVRLASLHHELDGPGFKSRGRLVNQTFHPSGVDKLVAASAGVDVRSVATARDDGWLPVGGSGEANSPEVTAWRRTPSFSSVVCHIVERYWSGGCTCKCRYRKTATCNILTIIYKKTIMKISRWQYCTLGGSCMLLPFRR